MPILLMTNTRRANKERVFASPYKNNNIMRDYADFIREIITKHKCEAFIGGYIGCKGDAYTGAGHLSKEEAIHFHSWQIEQFQTADIDFIMPSLMPVLDEAVGMAIALQDNKFPYIFSFMVRENGTISDGNTINNAIRDIDNAVQKKPLCYIANCIHPKILKNALLLNDTPLVRSRFKGIQANAAYMTPDELDKSSETKSSTPIDLANEIMELNNKFPLKIYGGCCGTDDTHLREFAKRMCVK